MKCRFQTTDGATAQFVLQRFDIAPFCCQTRRSDKLEKCVRSVALLCSVCRNLYLKKSFRGQYYFFCFHLKKTAAESFRLLREAYGEHAPSRRYV